MERCEEIKARYYDCLDMIVERCGGIKVYERDAPNSYTLYYAPKIGWVEHNYHTDENYSDIVDEPLGLIDEFAGKEEALEWLESAREDWPEEYRDEIYRALRELIDLYM